MLELMVKTYEKAHASRAQRKLVLFNLDAVQAELDKVGSRISHCRLKPASS
jgi:hypothetical protein